jgi:tetratricopeptide (TPR) repeat protein
MEPKRPLARLDRYGALGLGLALVVVYAASLAGGFLNYDDPWLIEQNPLLRRASLDALVAIWTDRGEETRMSLGAEYLPVRDTTLWLEARLWGLGPHALRATNLAIYVAAALVFRAYLLRALPAARALAEVTAWLFALHPVHAESAAWLAGRKDVLALLFMGLSLWCYAGPGDAGAGAAGAGATEGAATGGGATGGATAGTTAASARRWAWQGWLAVPFVLLACLSKGVAVATPLLFLIHDLLVGRRPRLGLVGASLGGALGVLALHVQVGRTVGMLAPLPGGGRVAAIVSMGPAWLGYVARAFVPVGLSVSHEVPDRAATEPLGWLAYVPLLALGALAAWRARRGSRLELAALLWFAVALAPTSQILAPLQNRAADRYLLLPVLGPCLVAASLLLRLRWRTKRGAPIAAIGVVATFGLASAERAYAFADSVRLWVDTVDKTTRPQAAYQLGMALRDRGDAQGAEQAFRLAILRSGPGDETGRRAINNLSVLLGAQGRHSEALALLAEAVRRFPADPRVLNNLAELTARHGDPAEARRRFDELVRRFPTYEPGLTNHRRRYGTEGKPSD